MYSYAQPMAFPVRALVYAAGIMRASAFRLRAAAKIVDRWIAQKRAPTRAVPEHGAMSCREPRYIGPCECDVQSVAAGDSTPARPRPKTPVKARAKRGDISIDVESAHATNSIAHLDVHTLKDIGAPGWLIARATERRDIEHLRWLGLTHG